MSSGSNSGPPPVHESWLPRQHALYRPRHGSRQWLALVCAVVFFVTPLLAQVLGARAAEIENRPLEPFPSPTEGWGFFTGLTPWAVDHLPLREEAITLADAVSRGVFREPPALGEGPGGTDPLPEDQPDGQAGEPPSVPQVVEGTDGWLYLGEEIENRCEVPNDLADTFASLHRLKEGVEASGREFVLVVAPDKATMVPEHLPARHADRDCVTEVSAKFWEHVRVSEYIVDLRGDLVAWGERRGAPVYPPLDTHWTDEGGIAMTTALAEAVHPGISYGWEVDPAAEWSVPADLPPLMGQSGEVRGRYYALRPDGERDRTRAVDSRFHTPLELHSPTAPGTVDRPVGLLADSFTIRALRYLAASFSELTVLHLRSFHEDHGRAAAAMLVDKEVVAVQIVERNLIPERSMLTDSDVVDTVTRELARHPVR
ncbi:alginate O-acetyltransferase AlgX-related protein [Haloechinothrix sp. LS1_15]|uniref:alginate O-acetyltransferase AlgX-related protein n=1 Tax=Haloechinothrix sp. LS1_15 TaxID=2652248 RepID=UPI00294AFBAF|nr:hypothetical protein [Haloechinothrix sp. LS1_15]